MCIKYNLSRAFFNPSLFQCSHLSLELFDWLCMQQWWRSFQFILMSFVVVPHLRKRGSMLLGHWTLMSSWEYCSKHHCRCHWGPQGIASCNLLRLIHCVASFDYKGEGFNACLIRPEGLCVIGGNCHGALCKRGDGFLNLIYCWCIFLWELFFEIFPHSMSSHGMDNPF